MLGGDAWPPIAPSDPAGLPARARVPTSEMIERRTAGLQRPCPVRQYGSRFGGICLHNFGTLGQKSKATGQPQHAKTAVCLKRYVRVFPLHRLAYWMPTKQLFGKAGLKWPWFKTNGTILG